MRRVVVALFIARLTPIDSIRYAFISPYVAVRHYIRTNTRRQGNEGVLHHDRQLSELMTGLRSRLTAKYRRTKNIS
jgi:hypothetical protein